jgi:hypothetical protein
MTPLTIIAILELINKAIAIGGELVPIALRAYTAIKAESGWSDDQLIAESRTLNDADATKLAALLAE